MAWHPLAWEPAAFAEIDPFPSAVLAHHYPHVPNAGDFTTIRGDEYGTIDLLVGGTPCQSFSVAGLRGGLGDDRGNLALEFLRLAQRTSPKWVVWENVPGVLSSDGGRDFGSILGGLAELGYGFAYRTLDAQYVRVDGFGRAVPQRRRRVFVVGYLGDWRRAAAVLFERESLCWDSAPRRETREGTTHPIAPSLTSSGRGVDRGGDTRGQDPVVAVASTGDVSHCFNAGGMGRIDYETETMVAQPIRFSAKDHGADAQINLSPTLRAGGFDRSHANAGVMPAIAFDARQSDVIQYGDMTGPLDTDGHTMAVAFAENSRAELRLEGGDGQVVSSLKVGGGKPGQGYPAIAFDMPHDTANIRAANGGSSRSYVSQQWSVRRLTPRECERLQGFPDDFTLVPYRGKPASDGPRYKALGNSMAVNVMRYIGQRIHMVDSL